MINVDFNNIFNDKNDLSIQLKRNNISIDSERKLMTDLAKKLTVRLLDKINIDFGQLGEIKTDITNNYIDNQYLTRANQMEGGELYTNILYLLSELENFLYQSKKILIKKL